MKKNYKKSTISRRKKKERILKNKINKIIRKKKYNQKGGDAATDLGASLFGMATGLVLNPYCIPKINSSL